MKLSSAEEYGLRCILSLAKHYSRGLSTVEEISKQEGLSQAYVEKLLLQLKKSGLVQSSRGATGGYSLNMEPSKIAVGAVLRALDGTILSDLCERFPGELGECIHLRGCQVRPIWVILAHHLFKILDRISLADLLQYEGESEVRRELYTRFPVSGAEKVTLSIPSPLVSRKAT